MTTAALERPWRKDKTKVKLRPKTSRLPPDRQSAFEVIREVEKERPKSLELAAAAAELKLQVDACRESLATAEAAWRAASREQANGSGSLDRRERYAHMKLDETASPAVAEFVADIKGEIVHLRNGDQKVLSAKFPVGWGPDMKEKKGNWSTFRSQSARMKALLACVGQAEELGREDLDDATVEAKLAALYTAVPEIAWEKVEAK